MIGSEVSDDGLDVIGDVHGQSEKLVSLLGALGYEERDGGWRHPIRRAAFIGDLIDRGDGQLETLSIVRHMVESGAALAVMGNHEYNAIAFATPDPRCSGEYLRRHTPSNEEQHRKFLAAVGAGSAEHDDWIDWFRTLPLWLEVDGLRLVHACWHPDSMARLQDLLTDGRIGHEGMVATSEKGSEPYEALEVLLKGPEIALPEQWHYIDNGGKSRARARMRWWDPEATTLRRVAHIQSDWTDAGGRPLEPLPDTPLDGEVAVRPYTDEVPLVFGHYWSRPESKIVTERAICVDLSAVKDGCPLAAYRWSGEDRIDLERLVVAY